MVSHITEAYRRCIQRARREGTPTAPCIKAAAADLTRQSRAAQGLPRTIEDRAALGRVAALARATDEVAS